MYEFSKTINDELVSVLFMRQDGEWHVQIGVDDAVPTLDLYTKDFATNPVTQWIHLIETSALPAIERDSKNYLKVKDCLCRMLIHVKDVVYNRKTLEETGLMSYGVVTRRAVVSRQKRIVDNFCIHLDGIKKFGVTEAMSDDVQLAEELVGLAFVLTQEEKNREKGETDELESTPGIIS